MGVLLLLLGLVGFVLSVVALVRPIARLGLGTRKRAGLALAVSFVVMIIGAALVPSDPAVETEKTTKAAVSPALAPSRAATAGPVDVLAQWKQLVATVKPCDLASKDVATKTDGLADGADDIYTAHRATVDAQEACAQASEDLGKLKAPASTDEPVREKLSTALDVCKFAYDAKATAYRQMASVLNGDASPEAVTKTSKSMDEAVARQTYCALSYMSAAEEAGVKVEDLETR